MKNFICLFFASVLCFSCTSNDADDYENNLVKNESFSDKGVSTVLDDAQREKLISDFAGVLSKAIYENKDVREFLKAEAVKQFDKDYDILYANIKNKNVNGVSFKDILANYTSDNTILDIEMKLPLVNILLPKIGMFNINPEEYDTDDNETPVAVSKENVTSLYMNGECVENLEKGQVPAFHVFVVNENDRVVVNAFTRSGEPTYSFKSPNFDGTKNNSRVLTRSASNSVTRAVDAADTLVGDKAIQAFNYFYKDDASVNSMALQRDYIYYGITPTKTQGALNHSVSEYISFIKIAPNAYFKIYDQRDKGLTNNDPYIKRYQVSKKGTYTEDELIDKMWTKGAYEFKIEVQTSLNEEPYVLMIPLRPDEIWNFNIKTSIRHKTMLRHTKYTYTIDPDKFTAKTVNLVGTDYNCSLGKWDIANEALYRYITIYEEDESEEKETTYSMETVRMKSSKFSGDIKLDLGFGKSDKASTGVGIEANSSNTVKETMTVKVTRHEKSDDLGKATIYFYDPIIEKKISDKKYKMRAYSTGIVTFGVYAN